MNEFVVVDASLAVKWLVEEEAVLGFQTDAVLAGRSTCISLKPREVSSEVKDPARSTSKSHCAPVVDR